MLEILKSLFGNNENLTVLVKDGAFLVDVRTIEEFVEGSADNAVNIPLHLVPSQLDKFKDKTQIIVFCRSGNRSGQAKTILEQNGFTNITNGGTWQEVQSQIKN